MNFLLKWFFYAIAIAITAYILPGVAIDGVAALLVASLVLGLINAFFRPILIILTLPVNILTLGLFTFAINAALVLLADLVVSGFYVEGFWWAMLFSIVVAIVSMIFNQLVVKDLQRPT